MCTMGERLSVRVVDKPTRTTGPLTAAALVAFAANSVLCRLALRNGLADAATFTAVRLVSGAVALASILLVSRASLRPGGSWKAALALFAYAAPFSFAYLRLTTGTGALILFGAVQTTMIGRDLMRGARPGAFESLGLALAVAGLVGLTAPGLAAPDPLGALLMAVAGMAWGVYSLLGRGVADPLAGAAGNFSRSVVFVVPFLFLPLGSRHIEPRGILLACASGMVASGVGYAVWYAALRGLPATRAAIVQLLVPVLAALAGVVFLGENVSLRLVLSGAVIFVGVGLAILGPKPGKNVPNKT
jgi:drug/metabolite transporter (DMT)-like permease